jgi:hypothetical protein
MAKINKPSSQYYTTPVRDFYLDLWTAREIPPTSGDELLIIQPKHDRRPDLLAYDIYGTPRLWWVFAMRNKDILVDPVEDFVAGTTIFIPAKETIESMM